MSENLTRPELIAEIRRVASEMETLGAAMDYYGGFNSTISEHGKEMIGAAQIARSWATGIEEQEND